MGLASSSPSVCSLPPRRHHCKLAPRFYGQNMDLDFLRLLHITLFHMMPAFIILCCLHWARFFFSIFVATDAILFNDFDGVPRENVLQYFCCEWSSHVAAGLESSNSGGMLQAHVTLHVGTTMLCKWGCMRLQSRNHNAARPVRQRCELDTRSCKQGHVTLQDQLPQVQAWRHCCDEHLHRQP